MRRRCSSIGIASLRLWRVNAGRRFSASSQSRSRQLAVRISVDGDAMQHRFGQRHPVAVALSWRQPVRGDFDEYRLHVFRQCVHTTTQQRQCAGRAT